MEQNIELCTRIILNSNKIVVLTGAGISTESGIRDFRSRTGLYTMAPEYILSLEYFYRNPKEFYEFAIDNLYHPDASPNDGHKILAKWEREGRLLQIITQNIDGLHQKAGSRNVIEFHGTMKLASCLNCGASYRMEEMVSRMKQKEQYYICDLCRSESYIKPDVVLFGDAGEWFTTEGFEQILGIIEEADCLLVLGSSMKVTPFSAFPRYKREGAPMVIINKGETPYDYSSDTYVIQHSIGDTLTKIDRNHK
jgi:NAD-dependent deacetylase